MTRLRWLASCGVAFVLLIGLSGCSPESPGLAAVGKDESGRLVVVALPCSNPADRALLVRLDQRGSVVGSSIAEWAFNQMHGTNDSPLIWPLVGPNPEPSGSGIPSEASLPDGPLGLYLQRDPEDGASGVEFTANQLGDLGVNQYVFRDYDTHGVRHGDLASFLGYAQCG